MWFSPHTLYIDYISFLNYRSFIWLVDFPLQISCTNIKNFRRFWNNWIFLYSPVKSLWYLDSYIRCIDSYRDILNDAKKYQVRLYTLKSLSVVKFQKILHFLPVRGRKCAISIHLKNISRNLSREYTFFTLLLP